MTPTTLEALERFLEEDPPAGLGAVQAAMARKVAAAIETAPDYALSRLVNSMQALLEALGDEDQLVERARASLEWLQEAS